jgi:hypothetical protein
VLLLLVLLLELKLFAQGKREMSERETEKGEGGELTRSAEREPASSTTKVKRCSSTSSQYQNSLHPARERD